MTSSPRVLCFLWTQTELLSSDWCSVAILSRSLPRRLLCDTCSLTEVWVGSSLWWDEGMWKQNSCPCGSSCVGTVKLVSYQPFVF